MPSREKKEIYFKTLTGYLTTYNQLFIVHADHVGSRLMSDIRFKMRGKGDVLMGKNTMMRKCINDHCEKVGPEADGWRSVMPLLEGNVGFIFVADGMMTAVRDIIVDNTVPAPARAGTEANVDVFIPPGPTGCDPSQTSYFQAMNVATKISRGQIEITSTVHCVKKGERVSPGAADLLQKLNITPFTFGLVPKFVYQNGAVFDPAVLDLSSEIIQGKFMNAVRNVAAVSIASKYPTLCSLPHSLALAVKMCCAVIGGAEADYTFEKGAAALLFMKDPAAALAAAAASGGGGGGKAAEEKEEEEEEEEEEEVAVNFGGDDAW